MALYQPFYVGVTAEYESKLLKLCVLLPHEISTGRKSWLVLSDDLRNTGLDLLFSIVMNYIGYQHTMYFSICTDGEKSTHYLTVINKRCICISKKAYSLMILWALLVILVFLFFVFFRGVQF